MLYYRIKISFIYVLPFQLERLAETGEETVLLTASRDDECTGHLSSHNAQKFVDSNDVSILKNKFLCFVRGKIEVHIHIDSI